MKQSETLTWKRWYRKNKARIARREAASRKAHPERYRQYHRKWYAKNKERLQPINRSLAFKRYHKNPGKFAKQARGYRRKARQEFIVAYGAVCKCCGESEAAFLTLEHKKRDGKAHRQQVGGTSTQVIADLKRRGWPKRNYELLCFNCNRASWELGKCPHRIKRRSKR